MVAAVASSCTVCCSVCESEKGRGKMAFLECDEFIIRCSLFSRAVFVVAHTRAPLPPLHQSVSLSLTFSVGESLVAVFSKLRSIVV